MYRFDPSLVHKRTHINLGIETVTNTQFLCGYDETVGKGLLHRPLHNYATGSSTTLAGSAKCARGYAFGSEIKISVLKHDYSILAAQFKGTTAQISPANFCDVPSHLR